jgi:hypothetical protein
MANNTAFSFIYKYIVNILLWVTVHIWSFFESLLFVGGFILCIMLPVVWPMKFFFAILWLIVFYLCSKVVRFLENYLERNKNSE